MDVLLLGIATLLISTLFCIADERKRNEELNAYLRSTVDSINKELVSSENAAQALTNLLCKK